MKSLLFPVIKSYKMLCKKMIKQYLTRFSQISDLNSAWLKVLVPVKIFHVPGSHACEMKMNDIGTQQTSCLGPMQ